MSKIFKEPALLTYKPKEPVKSKIVNIIHQISSTQKKLNSPSSLC